MVAMAVEASVAQLLRSGFVHVDPHEGNMLFTDDDELCYIDFGLMARVDPVNMEAFASGVCHMLAGKYVELSKGAADKSPCQRCFPSCHGAAYTAVNDVAPRALLPGPFVSVPFFLPSFPFLPHSPSNFPSNDVSPLFLPSRPSLPAPWRFTPRCSSISLSSILPSGMSLPSGASAIACFLQGCSLPVSLLFALGSQ